MTTAERELVEEARVSICSWICPASQRKDPRPIHCTECELLRKALELDGSEIKRETK